MPEFAPLTTTFDARGRNMARIVNILYRCASCRREACAWVADRKHGDYSERALWFWGWTLHWAPLCWLCPACEMDEVDRNRNLVVVALTRRETPLLRAQRRVSVHLLRYLFYHYVGIVWRAFAPFFGRR